VSVAAPRPPARPESRGALIAGASGLVGARLLALLAAEPSYREVHAVLRRALPDAPRRGPVDDVYLCLGTTIRAAGSQEAFRRVDFDAVVGVARLGRRLGATRCVAVTALGADAASRVFYNRVKGDAETALARLDFASLTILRPSLLDGQRTESRPAERLSLAVLRPVASLIPARWRPVPADAVARCMLAAGLRGEPGLRILESDRIVRFTG
jgi:uncharacterized protein YbjT (DUF2867 family)